jgi:hypothetical protein
MTVIVSISKPTTAKAGEMTCDIKYNVFLPTFMFKGYETIIQNAQKIVQNTKFESQNCENFRKSVFDMSKLPKKYLEWIVSVYDTPKSKTKTTTIIHFKGHYLKINILKDGLYAHVQISMASVLEVQEARDAEKDSDFKRGNGPFIVWLYD